MLSRYTDTILLCRAPTDYLVYYVLMECLAVTIGEKKSAARPRENTITGDHS